MIDFESMSTKEVIARYQELKEEVDKRKDAMWDKLVAATQEWESYFGPILDEEEYAVRLIPFEPGKIDYYT